MSARHRQHKKKLREAQKDLAECDIIIEAITENPQVKMYLRMLATQRQKSSMPPPA